MKSASFLSKNYVLAWIAGWKVLDLVSTFAAVKVIGWGSEINIVAATLGNFLGGTGYKIGVLFSLPLALYICYKAWSNYTVLVEFIAFVLPFVVVSNFLGSMAMFKLGFSIQVFLIIYLAVWGLVCVYTERFGGRCRWQAFVIGENSYY